MDGRMDGRVDGRVDGAGVDGAGEQCGVACRGAVYVGRYARLGLGRRVTALDDAEPQQAKNRLGKGTRSSSCGAGAVRLAMPVPRAGSRRAPWRERVWTQHNTAQSETAPEMRLTQSRPLWRPLYCSGYCWCRFLPVRLL